MPPQTLDRDALAARLGAAVARLEPAPATPVLAVDVDAFDASADDLVRRAGGKPVRVASKSVRVPDLLHRVLARPGFRGVLAFTLREALWLHEQGICYDVVVAYPSVDREALARLAASAAAASAITPGAGEVQTPLTGPAAARLRIGDLVRFRHVKAGELFEHGTDVHLLSGDSLAGTAPTYRGLGLAF